MSGLAGCLAGLMVWFGTQGSMYARRDALRPRLGGGGHRPAHARPRRSLPASLPWVFGGVVLGQILGGPAMAACGGAGAIVARRIRSKQISARRAAERDEQMTDAVRSVSEALRAGLSVPQALSYAAAETPPPLNASLRESVDALELGTSLDEVLDDWARSIDTEDARLVAGVLRLHRRSGGDLPAVLDQAAATLQERRASFREVRALTAQARMSGAILGLLPIGFFAFLWLTSRSDIQGAFRTPAGIVAVCLGLVLELIAFLWIRRLLRVA